MRVVGSVGAGNVKNRAGLGATSPGSDADLTRSGPHAEVDLRTSPQPVLLVRADVGVGTLTIDRSTGQEQGA